MTKINYKSDFEFMLTLRDAQGADLGFPPYDWQVSLRTAGAAHTFRAGCIGGKLVNCYDDGGRVHVVADNHGLPPGKVIAEVTLLLPRDDFPDGSLRVCYTQPVDIELTRENGCCPSLDDIALILPFIRGEKGEPGKSFTYADFTAEQLDEIADAASRKIQTMTEAEVDSIIDYEFNNI